MTRLAREPTHIHVTCAVPNAYARRRSHPPAKRATCSHGPLAAATASAARSACRCHSSHSTHPCTRFVGITPPQSSDRHSPVPAAAPCYKRHAIAASAADGCLASTRSTGPRSMHACRCHGSRSAHMRHLSAATEWLCGVARHNPPTAPPSVGPTWPKPGTPGPKEEGRLPKSPSRSIVRGRNGRGRGLRDTLVACLAAAAARRAYRCHGSLPSGCDPLTLLAASSHAKGPARGSLGRCHRRLSSAMCARARSMAPAAARPVRAM